uniref:Si:ch73-109d9.3 n=1 Tax=Electrophorus electricus TaxID=8005 RepID=A0AAY5EX54_ELEEL
MEIYSTPHCHKADHREPQSGSAGETSGLHISQHDHRVPQRDKLSGTKSCSPSNQDSAKQRTHSKGPDSKTEQPVRSSPSQPGPIEVVSCSEPHTVKQLASSSDSLAIKQEVVVVLPPEWEDVEKVRSETIHNPRGVMYIGGQSIHKSPPVPKPPQALQHFQRAYTDERTISALQSGRNLTQTFSIRTHGHAGHHVVRAPHSCTQCGKGFSHLCHLRAHQQIHTGERQFCCSLCGRSFTKLSNLKAHRRVHTGEPHVCHVCGKGFTRLSNFKQHQNIHTREKLFNCTHCGMRFNRSTHLRIHLRRHSRVGKSCHCRQCGKTFVCLKQLKGCLKMTGK